MSFEPSPEMWGAWQITHALFQHLAETGDINHARWIHFGEHDEDPLCIAAGPPDNPTVFNTVDCTKCVLGPMTKGCAHMADLAPLYDGLSFDIGSLEAGDESYRERVKAGALQYLNAATRYVQLRVQ